MTLSVSSELLADEEMRIVLSGTRAQLRVALGDLLKGMGMAGDRMTGLERDREWARSLLLSRLIELECAIPLPVHPDEIARWADRVVEYCLTEEDGSRYDGSNGNGNGDGRGAGARLLRAATAGPPGPGGPGGPGGPDQGAGPDAAGGERHRRTRGAVLAVQLLDDQSLDDAERFARAVVEDWFYEETEAYPGERSELFAVVANLFRAAKLFYPKEIE